ncbi:hypothetical protein MJO28_014064 [Puccinia striiformis f. sp. tritici]|uniref:Uncharacterized protein n=1 Tax=Puccinia striiformis f. sp. tritici TaxID=168172 RepID=A0ACC0DW90_9BASI|nr:hypothetical protein MJO28_014064 [Puccinia striiformis f. sp. tritici]
MSALTSGDFRTLDPGQEPSVRLGLSLLGSDEDHVADSGKDSRGTLDLDLVGTLESPPVRKSNPKKRTYSSEGSLQSVNPDWRGNQQRSDVHIVVPSDGNSNHYPGAQSDLPFFFSDPKSNQKRYKVSSMASGMVAHDFSGWIFPDEIRANSPLADSASQTAQAHSSRKLTPDVTEDFHVDDQPLVPTTGANILSTDTDQHLSETDDGHFEVFEKKYGDPIKRATEPAEDLSVKNARSAYYKTIRGDKIWVWVFGNTVYRVEPDEQTLKLKYGLTLARFNNVFASEVEELLSKSQTSTKHAIERRDVYEIILQFSDILWVNSLRLLASLGVTDQIECLKEQALIYRWLLGCNQGDLMPALELVKISLTFKQSDEAMYRMSKPKRDFDVVVGFIAERQALMTEAVTMMLATYYKTINPEKWRSVFENDVVFVSHISKTATEYFHSVTRASRGEMHRLKLFPWVDLCDPSSTSTLLRKLQFTRSHGVEFDSYIVQIPPLEKWNDEEIGVIPPDLMETGNIDCEDKMKAIGWTRWGWISIITIKKRDKRRVEWPIDVPTDSAMLDIQRLQMSNLIERHHFAHEIIRSRGFLERARVLLEVLLALNQRLMEALGHTPTTLVYLEEQNKLQDFFLRLVASSPKGLSKQKQSEENSPSKTRFIQVIVFKATDCKATEKSFLPYLRGPSKVSKQNLIMSEAAAKILACYYRQENYIKWKNVFGNENKFFMSFEKIEKRLKTAFGYKRFYTDTIPEMYKTGMIPWRNPLIITNDQRVELVSPLGNHLKLHQYMELFL